MSEHYWRFGEWNQTPVYGWGTEDEASRYCDHLCVSKGTEHIHFDMVDEEDAEAMKLGDEAFVIEEEIRELKAQGEWK